MIIFLSLVTMTTATSQHTDCTDVNRGAVRMNSRCKDVVLSITASWNDSTAKQLSLSPARDTFFRQVRKRRDIMGNYSTTIKQLQGPQLRSYMLLLSHNPLPLPLSVLASGPHVLTHRPLWASSHTSVLPLHTKQLGSSWNRTTSEINM